MIADRAEHLPWELGQKGFQLRVEEIHFLNGKQFGSNRRDVDSWGRGQKLFFCLWDHITGGKNDLQRLISFFLSLTICQGLILSGY